MKYESLLCCCIEVGDLEGILFYIQWSLGHLDHKGGKGASDNPGKVPLRGNCSVGNIHKIPVF